MITLIDPLEDARWDEFIQDHPLGWVTHLSGWKKVLEERFHHMKGYYLALVDQTKNEIKAALPLFEVKSWLTGLRLVSIPFATLCDPLFFQSADIEELFDAAINLSAKLGAPFIEIRAFMSAPTITDIRFVNHNFYKHHYLKLECEPEELKKTFHRTCVRQRISRAIKSNLTLISGSNESDLRSFYRLYVFTRKRLGLPPQPYTFFKSLWDTFYLTGRLQLLLANYEGKPIAGLILLKWKDRVSAEFAASDDGFVSLSPNHFLFWEAIKLSFYEGYKIFDFGRTSPNNKTLMDFKDHWGTIVTDLTHYFYPATIHDKRLTSDDTMLYKIMRKTCQKFPDYCNELLGRFLYRHLS